MQYRQINDLNLSVLSLGTWAFGGDKWWGKQEDKDSCQVLDAAIKKGITTIDTAPVYGRGRSERIIGSFIKKNNLREKIILATKVGLSWDGPKISHNLKKQRMLEEFDESRKRLQTDYFDIYQVHWPDPDTPIAQTAAVMSELYERGVIKVVGVSNYSVAQMQEFMKHSPLHVLQPQYSMFERGIEHDIVGFCIENNIGIITYAPLYSGILTGKFFFDNVKVPDDTNRQMKSLEFKEPRLTINKKTLSQLKDIAANYKKTLAELVINWNFNQKGITSAIVGIRRLSQLEDNLGSVGFTISREDMQKINQILNERESQIK
jgi:aryl-alcohol dehydrogenase-like predicted oxidoreductase